MVEISATRQKQWNYFRLLPRTFIFEHFSGPEDPPVSILPTWKLLDLQKSGISW
jgi:hypothetical protein